MNIKHLLVYLSLGLTVFGVILRSCNYTLGNISLLTGLLYLCLYYLIKTIKEIRRGSDNKLIIYFQLLIALMSIVIGTKYMYTTIGYYLGLVMIPLFVIYTVIYWIKTRSNRIDLSVTTITYIILTIPMFFIYYDQYPTPAYFTYRYPQQYVKYNYIRLDNTFDTASFNDDHELTEILALSEKAHILAVYEERYEEAIPIYHQIIAMMDPPSAYMYYKLSDCYAYTGQYEHAISALNSAIEIEPTKAEYYNLRGVMYYALRNKELAMQDIEKSLALDSTSAVTYVNQVLVYLNLYNDPQKAHESMKKAELYNYEFTLSFPYEKEEIEKKLAQKQE